MGYRLIGLDEPVLIPVSKPLLTEFDIHHRLESCELFSVVSKMTTAAPTEPPPVTPKITTYMPKSTNVLHSGSSPTSTSPDAPWHKVQMPGIPITHNPLLHICAN